VAREKKKRGNPQHLLLEFRRSKHRKRKKKEKKKKSEIPSALLITGQLTRSAERGGGVRTEKEFPSPRKKGEKRGNANSGQNQGSLHGSPEMGRTGQSLSEGRYSALGRRREEKAAALRVLPLKIQSKKYGNLPDRRRDRAKNKEGRGIMGVTGLRIVEENGDKGRYQGTSTGLRPWEKGKRKGNYTQDGVTVRKKTRTPRHQMGRG